MSLTTKMTQIQRKICGKKAEVGKPGPWSDEMYEALRADLSTPLREYTSMTQKEKDSNAAASSALYGEMSNEELLSVIDGKERAEYDVFHKRTHMEQKLKALEAELRAAKASAIGLKRRLSFRQSVVKRKR